MTFQATLRQQVVYLLGDFIFFFIMVDVQDAPFFKVEFDIFGFSDLEKVIPGRDGQSYRFDGVVAIVGDVANEFGHPAVFVPRRHGIHQQRCITPEHPFHAFQDG